MLRGYCIQGYIIKRLLNEYRNHIITLGVVDHMTVRDSRPRHMNSFRIVYDIHSVTYKYSEQISRYYNCEDNKSQCTERSLEGELDSES